MQLATISTTAAFFATSRGIGELTSGSLWIWTRSTSTFAFDTEQFRARRCCNDDGDFGSTSCIADGEYDHGARSNNCGNHVPLCHWKLEKIIAEAGIDAAWFGHSF